MVAVDIPRTALVRVDATGRVLAVATNTGCAPRAGDAVYVAHADGTLEAARLEDVARRRWTGNFTRPGVYVSQQP